MVDAQLSESENDEKYKFIFKLTGLIKLMNGKYFPHFIARKV